MDNTAQAHNPSSDHAEFEDTVPMHGAAGNASLATAIPVGNSNYFARHWRGELSLGVSYWVNGFLGNIVLVLLIFGAAGLAGSSQSNYSAVAYWVGVYALALVMVIWQFRGVWYSANRHIASTQRSGWANAAKAMIVLGVLRFLGDFVSTGIPAIRASIDQGNWLTQNAKWEINLLREGTEVELRGGIGHGIAKDFERTLKAAPGIQLVHVNLYMGGLVAEGVKLHELIRARKLKTYTSSECVSACSIAFLGGTERLLKQGARLGFHTYTAPGVTDQDHSSDKKLLIAAGVNPVFVDRVFATPAKSMWYPTPDELRANGVISAMVSGEQFGLSGFQRNGAMAKLEEELVQIKLYAAIRAREPELYQQILAKFEQGIQSGKSMEELRSVVVPHVRELLGKYLPAASDEGVKAFAQHIGEVAKLLQSRPDVCMHYLRDGDAQSSNLAISLTPTAMRKQEMDVIAKVISDADLSRPAPTRDEKQRVLHRVGTQAMQFSSPGAVQEIGKPNADPQKWCEGFDAVYSAIIGLPDADARIAVLALRE